MSLTSIRRHPFLSMAILLALAWACYLQFGNVVGRFAASSFGPIVSKLGASKVPDPARYVTMRLSELLWLISLTWLTALIVTVLFKALSKKSGVSIFSRGVILFLALNLWCLAAAKTALFWLVLRGTTVENHAQFRVKENLVSEVKVHPVIALVGNSQARSEITEEDFNTYANGRAWMMECHFPGCRAADVYLLSERFTGNQVDEYVYYVSPGSFYVAESDSAIARDLLRLRDFPVTISMAAWGHFPVETRVYAALGIICPLFQYRSPFQHAIFGSSEILPPAIATRLTPSPVKVENTSPACVRALATSSPEADYQKDAFRRFLQRATEKRQHVIVIGGQWNPVAEAQFPADLRPDYERFLKECARAYPAMTLVWQNEILVQSPDAYMDYVHCTEKTSEYFTEAFAKWYFERNPKQGTVATH